VDDLRGSATERLIQLDEISVTEVDNEWLVRHLRVTLQELASAQAVADAEQDRREDY
jgi:hypothetical protein